jgi:RNA polymerase primary sigma factor
LAEELALPVAQVRKILELVREPMSLDAPIGEDGDRHLYDSVPDEVMTSPAQVAMDGELREQTRRTFQALTPRERKVLRMRFGISEKSDHTLEEVGQELGVTRERIRQIQAKAVSKLQHARHSKLLEEYT